MLIILSNINDIQFQIIGGIGGITGTTCRTRVDYQRALKTLAKLKQ